MICEIQLSLEEYARVKHKIHALYSVVRIIDRERFMTLTCEREREECTAAPLVSIAFSLARTTVLL